MEEFKINYKDREIYCVLTLPEGKEKIPMIIFSHGYNGTCDGFKYQAAFFADKGIGSVRFDFCGGSVNSRSSMETKEMTIVSEMEDLEAVVLEVLKMERTNPKEVYLHGESQGGFVSALVAARLGEKIKGLTLIYPALCIPDNWKERYPKVEDIPEVENFWGMELGRNFFLSIRDIDVYEEISKYQGKVVIVHGDKDAVVPVDYSKEACKHYKNAVLDVLHNEGHGFTPGGVEKELIYVYVKMFS